MLSKFIILSLLLIYNLQAETIKFKGYNYTTVKSPYTGKIWLDRNLGANSACTKSTDTECYGDYYQWGRSTDGHQRPTSRTTDENANHTSNVGHELFITSDEEQEFKNDWALFADKKGKIREKDWNPCPSEFRVPTRKELKAETIDQGVENRIDAFETFLRLPSAGNRNYHDGSFSSQGTYGSIWSSSPLGSKAWYLGFGSEGAETSSYYRAYGYSIRCIKK